MLGKYTQSKWLKTEDLIEQEDTMQEVTISKVKEVDFKNSQGEEETKVGVKFREYEKPLILNVTNIKVLQQLFGKDAEPEDMEGRRVMLFAVPTQMPTGESTFGIRIRGIKKKAAGTPDQRGAPPKDDEPDGFVDGEDPGPADDDDIPF